MVNSELSARASMPNQTNTHKEIDPKLQIITHLHLTRTTYKKAKEPKNQFLSNPKKNKIKSLFLTKFKVKSRNPDKILLIFILNYSKSK